MTANGDVANKIGTYLKALAAHDTGVPFYVALPHSTIDWTLDDGRKIPIEERSADEMLKMTGRLADGRVVTGRYRSTRLACRQSCVRCHAHRLVTGFITERGVAPASRAGLLSLYPSGRETMAKTSREEASSARP